MKTAIRKIFNKHCTLMNKDYNDYVIRKPNEFIKEIAGLFASLNPERVKITNELIEHKANNISFGSGKYGRLFKFHWIQGAKTIRDCYESDLCSGSQDETEKYLTNRKDK